MSHPWRPDLEHLSLKELYNLLPSGTQKQIDRVVWEKTKKLPSMGIKVDKKYMFGKHEILYMFDPLLPNLPEINALSSDEKRLFLCAMDPVTWARQFLKFEPRIYQILLMRSQEPKLACRYGRRCLTADTMIAMADGSFKPISEIVVGEQILSYSNEAPHNLISNTVLETYDNGIQDIYRITLTDGHIIDCTSNHPFLTEEKQWKSIDDGLSVNDLIVIVEDEGFSAEKIKSIELLGKMPTYDISVDGSESLHEHSFIANGMVVHNSGKSWGMMFRILHHAVTRPNYRVIIVTPYMAQVDLMYSDIWQILGHGGLRSTEEIREAFGIERTLRKPAEITFRNGSIIRMFTAGANSGGNANTVRGQEADLLVLDELDFFGDPDLSAIMPMLQDTSEEKVYEKTLLISSTPNGRRDLFYAIIDPDNPNSGVKEYWFSCYANPLFNKDGEENARQLAKTESQFEHEYIASWGDVAIGVFRHQILVSSEFDYKYQMGRDPKHGGDHIILGIDWDKYGAGVNFCIIQQLGSWAKEDMGKYKVIQRYELPRDKVTDVLGAGVREAIMLDQKFDFDYVYTDRGYGERQYEELIDYFGKRVVGVNYSSSVKELDMNEGIISSEPLKPFAVDNAASIFERGNLILNKNDEKFREQLLAYMRIKVSVGGRPIFGSSNPTTIGDHGIDAMCFSLLGFAEKFGDLIPRMSMLRARAASVESMKEDPADPKLRVYKDADEMKKIGRGFTIRSESAWGKRRMSTKFKRSSW
jgi:hypothetical protein